MSKTSEIFLAIIILSIPIYAFVSVGVFMFTGSFLVPAVMSGGQEALWILLHVAGIFFGLAALGSLAS